MVLCRISLTPTMPRKPSVYPNILYLTQTPMRVAAASVPSGILSARLWDRDATYPVIQTQLLGGVVNNVYEMPRYTFRKFGFSIEQACEDLKKNPKPMFDGSRWTAPPVLVTQGDGLKENERHVCKFLNDIAAVVSAGRKVPVRRKWHPTWTNRPLGNTEDPFAEACQRHPDCAALPVGVSPAAARRRDQVVTLEVKAGSDGTGKDKASVQVAENARLIFSSQHTRRFVLGVTWIGETVNLYHYDRAGVVVSVGLGLHTKIGRRL